MPGRDCWCGNDCLHRYQADKEMIRRYSTPLAAQVEDE